MDNICELEGICGDEMPQILDLGSDVKNNEIIKESFQESNPPFENISNQEEFSVNLEKLNFGNHEFENVRNEENKISNQHKQVLSISCDTSPESNSDEPAKPIAFTESKTDLLSHNDKIEVDLTYVKSQDEGVNEAVDKALDKDLNIEEYYANDGVADIKEASVQTVVDNKTLVTNESCPICRLQQVELKSDLTALCLEYPPYKKIKIHKLDGLSASTSETKFMGIIEDGLEDIDMERMRRRKVSSDDQIVPQCPSEIDLKKGQNPESSTRSIRIGLSKRTKPRPLHQVPKLQASDPTENNS